MPALAVPAVAVAATSDPIFELIEQHRATYAAANAHPDDEDYDGAGVHELNCRLAEMSPITLAGVIAIMRYRRELQQAGDGVSEFGYDLFAIDITAWLAVIEQALEGIARRTA